MSVNATSVTAKTPRLIYIGVFLWALIAACMVIWPNPRVIFPFLGLTLLFLLSIPFRIAFAGLIIFALAHNIGFRNIFVLTIAGRNVAIVEIVLAFVLLLAIIDFIAKRIKIVLSPMLILISIFFISSLLQFIRGIYLGYNPSFIRSVFRSLLFYLLAFPIAIYFGKNAPQKFITI